MSPVLIKYGTILAIIFIIATGAYYKGYSDKADAVALQELKDFKTVTEKLDKVYSFSVDKANSTRDYVNTTDMKLKSIISQLGKQPLTSIPCVPSEEFANKWNQINDTVQSSN